MKALVTGGGGFLGKAIVERLLRRNIEVVSVSRSHHAPLADLGVAQICVDLGDMPPDHPAFAGCDIVFHVAAKAGVWGDYAEYHRANVLGTINVIATCRHHGIDKLVYTSSPSVVFGGEPIEGADESLTYPQHFDAPYPETKAIAEQQILAANDSTLATVALRPHLIWGPGDNHLVPRIIERGRKRQLRRIGRQDNLVDCVYIDNAADAHVLAAEKLISGADIGGRAYFISQGDPRPLWDIVNAILACADVAPIERHVPVKAAYAIGWLLEKIYTIAGIQAEPRITRFVARELSCAHWFDISAARRDLGYRPRISMEQGLEKLREHLREN
ncbi:MAG: NAD-dependent epimerase/dehydratase family protein [Desulfuromonadaceae bacterium]|nr:NAD-dependent epimerase/dehydratase family protein [Desulfuromonas sp.]MDY0186137.1 NAD-dependent epimerase/dehydratase family protein [Desulfuromonadaceae bacterium]